MNSTPYVNLQMALRHARKHIEEQIARCDELMRSSTRTESGYQTMMKIRQDWEIDLLDLRDTEAWLRSVGRDGDLSNNTVAELMGLIRV